MELFDIVIQSIGLVTSIFCAWFTVKRKLVAWPFGIVSVLIYAYYYYTLGTFGLFIAQLFFLGQSIYGWINWKKHQKDDATEIEMGNSTLAYVGGPIFAFLVMGLSALILFNCSWWKEGAEPDYILAMTDGLLMGLSLWANYLITRRWISGWLFWIVYDMLMFLFLWTQGLTLLAITSLVFLCFATWGLISWNMKLIKDEKVQLS